MDNTKDFIAELFLPNGVKFGFVTSKSNTSEGRMLAKIIARGRREGYVQTSEPGTEFKDSPKLQTYMVVREWDGISKADKAAETNPWAETSDSKPELG